MPRLAEEALMHRLERSGQLDRLKTDVRILFKKRLIFELEGEAEPGDWVRAPVQVGAVQVGHLAMPPSARAERNIAYRHWLQMAARSLADELQAPHGAPMDVLPAKVLQAVHIVRERYHEALRLAELARAVNLSEERLSRLFHESLGITFSDYLNELRLAEARRRLASNEGNITEVAYASGYQSLSQFNRRFRASEGRTPREYRRMIRAGQLNATHAHAR